MLIQLIALNQKRPPSHVGAVAGEYKKKGVFDMYMIWVAGSDGLERPFCFYSSERAEMMREISELVEDGVDFRVQVWSVVPVS